MRWLCFSCERAHVRWFFCRRCGERECADCFDARERLCGACSYADAARSSLDELIADS